MKFQNFNPGGVYPCEIPGCGYSVPIRSTIKTGEYTGKKCCPACKQKIEGKKKQHIQIKKTTVENSIKRKAQRMELPEFFKNTIEELKKNPICQNCGTKINYKLFAQNNVAHILNKSHYKSVMSNPYNKIFLCDSKDNPSTGKSCHYEFDNKISKRPDMPVFNIALMLYKSFQDECKEFGKEREIFEKYS